MSKNLKKIYNGLYTMPYLDSDEIYYPSINRKKYSAVMADILKLHIATLENSVYPTNII